MMDASVIGYPRAVKLAALLFGLHKRVTRRTYLLWGFGLGVAKYLIDTGLRTDAVGSGPEAM